MSKDLHEQIFKLRQTLMQVSFEIENTQIDIDNTERDIILIKTYMAVLQQNIEVLKDPELVITLRGISEIRKEQKLCEEKLAIKQGNKLLLENRLERLYTTENEMMDELDTLNKLAEELEKEKVVFVDFTKKGKA